MEVTNVSLSWINRIRSKLSLLILKDLQYFKAASSTVNYDFDCLLISTWISHLKKKMIKMTQNCLKMFFFFLSSILSFLFFSFFFGLVVESIRFPNIDKNINHLTQRNWRCELAGRSWREDSLNDVFNINRFGAKEEEKSDDIIMLFEEERTP